MFQVFFLVVIFFLLLWCSGSVRFLGFVSWFCIIFLLLVSYHFLCYPNWFYMHVLVSLDCRTFFTSGLSVRASSCCVFFSSFVHFQAHTRSVFTYAIFTNASIHSKYIRFHSHTHTHTSIHIDRDRTMVYMQQGPNPWLCVRAWCLSLYVEWIQTLSCDFRSSAIKRERHTYWQPKCMRARQVLDKWLTHKRVGRRTLTENMKCTHKQLSKRAKEKKVNDKQNQEV